METAMVVAGCWPTMDTAMALVVAGPQWIQPWDQWLLARHGNSHGGWLLAHNGHSQKVNGSGMETTMVVSGCWPAMDTAMELGGC